MKKFRYVIIGIVCVFIFVISLNINLFNSEERICGFDDDNSMPMPFSIIHTEIL